MDADLALLKSSGQTPAVMKSLTMSVQAIKGSCMFLELHRLEKLTDAGDKIINKLVQGELKSTDEPIAMLFQVADAIKFNLNELQANKKEPEGDDAALISKIDAVLEGKPAEPAPVAEEKPAKPAVSAEDALKKLLGMKAAAKEVPVEVPAPVVQQVVEEPPQPVVIPQADTKKRVVIDMLNWTTEQINEKISEAMKNR